MLIDCTIYGILYLFVILVCTPGCINSYILGYHVLVLAIVEA